MALSLQWKRPTSVECPRVWATFQAKDVNSNDMVEYRIQDLPESMFEKAVQHMIDNYLHGEPITSFFDGINDPDHVGDYVSAWRAMLPQRATLICLKADSDEIVGMNVNYILTKSDTIAEDINKTCKSVITKTVMKMFGIMYKNFDVFEKYGVDEYLASFGLSVAPQYRGRRIGEQLFKARKSLGKSCGLKLTHTFFTSDFSNRIADNIGFKLDVGHTIDEIQKLDPTVEIRGINSKEVTLKTWVF